MTKRKSKSPRRGKKSSSNKLGKAFYGKLAVVLLLIGGVTLAYLDALVRSKFEGRKWALPAHVFARPLELYEGLSITPDQLVFELRQLGYIPVQQLSGRGQFAREGNRFDIYTRGFSFSDGEEKSRVLQLSIDDGMVMDLDAYGDVLVRLEPAKIGGIYPGHGEDRRLVRLQEVPELLYGTLLAVEDRHFWEHWGLSPRSIARAALANLKAGRTVQGGSTVTQQLVKNFYLTQERSLTRKAIEAAMAVLLELHYSKEEILETYLNEVYLGQRGRRGVHGFGLASEHYFQRPLSELQPHQFALLVGGVKGASYYNPWRHPERAKARRNLVIDAMEKEGLLSKADASQQKQQPLKLRKPSQVATTGYPAYIDLVKRQLRRDYREEDLRSEGLRIFTAFDPWVQYQAEQSLSKHLQAIDPSKNLQGAMVVASVEGGEVQAVVGDRNPRYPGFNRAIDAVRQVGSLIKPAIYLTGFEQGYHLASPLDDSPVSYSMDEGSGRPDSLWQPKNFDNKSLGRISYLDALAKSRNQASARLGMELGVGNVLYTVERLGVTRYLPRYPSVLLGTSGLSPLEVTGLYHTIAAGGFHSPLKSIRSVVDHHDSPLSRYPLTVEQRIDPASIHQLQFALQWVMRNGTGNVAYRSLPKTVSVAGKTGTTNDYRDSWFAGFNGSHVSAVWVGRDDNGNTSLTGSRGALPIWVNLHRSLDAPGLAPVNPEGIRYHWVDRTSGEASGENCRNSLYMPFPEHWQPQGRASCEKRENPLLFWLKDWLR